MPARAGQAPALGGGNERRAQKVPEELHKLAKDSRISKCLCSGQSEDISHPLKCE